MPSTSTRPRRGLRPLDPRRRRGDAPRRDERQRRLRLPRRRPQHPAARVRPRGRARRGGRRPGRLPRPRRLRPPPHRRRARRARRRAALPDRRARRHRRVAGTRVRYVKPHGALYNAHRAPRGQAGGGRRGGRRSTRRCRSWACPARAAAPAAEAGFDQRSPRPSPTAPTRPDGLLVPRHQPGAVITDADVVARRCVQMATEGTSSPSTGAPFPSRHSRSASTVTPPVPSRWRTPCVARSTTPASCSAASLLRRAGRRRGRERARHFPHKRNAIGVMPKLGSSPSSAKRQPRRKTLKSTGPW